MSDHTKNLLIICSTLVLITVAATQCRIEEERSTAIKAKACMDNGGTWARGFWPVFQCWKEKS